jgi:hypothetical protein
VPDKLLRISLTPPPVELDVSSFDFKPEPEEDVVMPSGTTKISSGHLRANFLYAVATCAMGGVGWFVWSNLNRPPAPPLPAQAVPVASVDELLRTPGGSGATPPQTVVTALPTSRPTRAGRPTRGNQHVRGGITIVGPAGTTSTVAPPTKNDLGAPTPEANVSSTLISAPPGSPAANEVPGPKFYTAPPVGPSSAANSSSPSGALRFYSFDANIPSVIQRLNRGESGDKWQTRVTVRPNN